jgi:hypothetical protein
MQDPSTYIHTENPNQNTQPVSNEHLSHFAPPSTACMTRSTSSAALFHPGARTLLAAYTRPVVGAGTLVVAADSSPRNAVGVIAGVSVIADEVSRVTAAGSGTPDPLGPNQVPSRSHPARRTRI